MALTAKELELELAKQRADGMAPLQASPDVINSWLQAPPPPPPKPTIVPIVETQDPMTAALSQANRTAGPGYVDLHSQLPVGGTTAPAPVRYGDLPTTSLSTVGPSHAGQRKAISTVTRNAEETAKEAARIRAETGGLITVGDSGEGAAKEPEIDLASKLLPKGGGVSVLPAHEVRRQGPEFERLANTYLGEKEGAAGAMTAANMQVLEAQKRAAAERAAIESQAAAERKNREAAKKTVIDQYLGEQKQLMDQVKNYDFDPEGKFYGEGAGGAFKRIASVIAIGLGGFAAGIKGGPNQAYQIIRDGIEDEYKKQSVELSKLKGNLEDSRSLLAQKRLQFGDEDVAQAAFKADLLGAAQARAEAQLADAGSDIERAKLKATIAELAGERANLQKDVFGWQGPQLSGGDPRIKRFEELSDKILLASKGVLSPTQARNQAFSQVFGVEGAPALPYGGSKGGGGRNASLIQQATALKGLLATINAEKALVRKGPHFSLADAARSMVNHEHIVNGMGQAIDRSSSDSKLREWKSAAPDPIGYTGAWTDAGRLASLNEMARIVGGELDDLTATQQAMGSGGTLNDEPDKEADVSTFTPDQ